MALVELSKHLDEHPEIVLHSKTAGTKSGLLFCMFCDLINHFNFLQKLYRLRLFFCKIVGTLGKRDIKSPSFLTGTVHLVTIFLSKKVAVKVR